jgi:hypothetical protein
VQTGNVFSFLFLILFLYILMSFIMTFSSCVQGNLSYSPLHYSVLSPLPPPLP